MKTIVKMNFGSHLYGTNTETSDKDLKGVYLPNLNDCIVGNVKRSIVSNTKSNANQKNTNKDTDCEIYSLQYFLLELGKNGDTTFLDMIHAPDSMLIEKSEIWQQIRANRAKFYTKSLKSYIGYCRSQASKYGIKGSKLEEAQKINWKSISHAFRVGYQLKELYTTGDLIFPLKDAEFIKEIKKQKFHFSNDKIADKLENLVNEIEVLASNSNYPQSVDLTYWNNFIINLYK